MNKLSFATLAAASALVAGVAFAQTNAPTPADSKTSTAGAGCTATGNAMAGGNLGGNPQNVHCAPNGSTAAVTTGTAATPATVATPAPSTTYSSTSSASSTTTTDNSNMASTTPSSTDMGSHAPAKKTRVAKADRG